MNLGDYITYEGVGRAIVFAYRPTGEVLLVTQHVSLDTLMRLAVVDHAKRNRISL